ncbi:MAG: RNA polymerase sigma-54 factor [Acidobacteriales bacterium 13_2_20CM_2_55_5]|nr:MAG: RNA polymerase sigma-54 factor [Acidobacteriales bacterium 13_2_20CM_2_55_5]
MVLLQPKLHLKVSQRQILTPGLVQMVSVLALNKLELRDMITAEMVENPVLEELEDSVPLIDELGRRQEDRDRPTPEENTVTAVEKKDPFEEIDFGSFFQEYLDPGYRSPGEMEEIERPSFENFLSKPGNLTDHLTWQLGAIPTRPAVREAAELIIGNLSEDGYLIASDDELMGVAPPAPPEVDATIAQNVVKEAAALGLATAIEEPDSDAHIPSEWNENEALDLGPQDLEPPDSRNQTLNKQEFENAGSTAATGIAPALDTTPKVSVAQVPEANPVPKPVYRPNFSLSDLHEALELVRQMDPPGVACRGLRECLQHLRALQNKQYKEIAKAIARPIEAVQQALEYIRTLDPRPGLRYNKVQPRLIEPDVAFVKHGDEWLVMMNDDDVPQLRLNPAYKRLLSRDTQDKDTRNYVKERYKSAIQLIKNIEQRKQTILKVCYAIVTRQPDFLEKGIDQLKPMMIKEVAEEIGVHPSTVSRAVANKYAHTPQGVFELRYFFSESVNGPQGGNTSLLILKRRVKKLIEEEDPTRPLTDEQITRILQSQGIQVTRRTVAKYREDMRIPSTHQRRVKK